MYINVSKRKKQNKNNIMSISSVKRCLKMGRPANMSELKTLQRHAKLKCH